MKIINYPKHPAISFFDNHRGACALRTLAFAGSRIEDSITGRDVVRASNSWHTEAPHLSEFIDEDWHWEDGHTIHAWEEACRENRANGFVHMLNLLPSNSDIEWEYLHIGKGEYFDDYRDIEFRTRDNVVKMCEDKSLVCMMLTCPDVSACRGYELEETPYHFSSAVYGDVVDLESSEFATTSQYVEYLFYPKG